MPSFPNCPGLEFGAFVKVLPAPAPPARAGFGLPFRAFVG